MSNSCANRLASAGASNVRLKVNTPTADTVTDRTKRSSLASTLKCTGRPLTSVVPPPGLVRSTVGDAFATIGIVSVTADDRLPDESTATAVTSMVVLSGGNATIWLNGAVLTTLDVPATRYSTRT